MPAANHRRHGVAVLLTTVVVALTGTAWPAAAQPPKRPRPLENIKTLTGWSSDEVRAEMRLMSEALGVKCDYCHVQGNFASDEKRFKHTARRMLELTTSLNADYFAGLVPATPASPAGAPAAAASAAPAAAVTSKLGRVTCYTCHQGAAIPRQSAGPGAFAW